MELDIVSKEEVLDLLEYLLVPYLYKKSDNKKKVLAVYDIKVQNFEQFSRLLLGVTPYLYNKNDVTMAKYTAEKLLSFINPENDLFCEITYEIENTQLFVEMFSPLFFLYTCQKQLEPDFIDKNKDIIITWFSKIDKCVYKNNWIWFQLLVNTLLYKLGLRSWNKRVNEELHKKLDQIYYKDGLYFDGPGGPIDYYNSFAFQFYSLIYVHLMKDEDSENIQKYRERAKSFSQIYFSFFSDSGVSIPYGRSLIYRFGVLAYLGALIYSEEEVIPWCYVKDLIKKNLNQWMHQDIFNDSFLNIGFYYENMNIMEDYNGFGSPYWAFKVFVLLLSDNKAFWDAPIKKFCVNKKELYIDPYLNLYNHNGEAYLFPIIKHLPYKNANFNDKYEKFVYSSLFGFNVSKDCLYGTIAIDSTLAISQDGETFITRKSISSELVENNIIKSIWNVNSQICITSYSIVELPWNIRIHFIESNDDFYMVEGAFPVKKENIKISEMRDGVLIGNDFQQSGIKSWSGGLCRVENLFPNTNLFFRQTLVPICHYYIKKGCSYVVTGAYGDKTNTNTIKPNITINVQGKEHICININGKMYTLNYTNIGKRNKSQLKMFERLKRIYKYTKKYL
ncbi:MAG: DUF2264 domain-containing protein [Clostridiaceae bacterium]|nr:DUF2264 domain-containing protein [Clostridiaceae bacterium]